MPRIYPESIQKKREKEGVKIGVKKRSKKGQKIGRFLGSKMGHFLLAKKVKKIILLIYAPYIPGGYSKKKRKNGG